MNKDERQSHLSSASENFDTDTPLTLSRKSPTWAAPPSRGEPTLTPESCKSPTRDSGLRLMASLRGRGLRVGDVKKMQV